MFKGALFVTAKNLEKAQAWIKNIMKCVSNMLHLYSPLTITGLEGRRNRSWGLTYTYGKYLLCSTGNYSECFAITYKGKGKRAGCDGPCRTGKLSSGHRIGKGQFSFQSQRKAMPKNAQIATQLHSPHMLVK